jgi:cold shock protein
MSGKKTGKVKFLNNEKGFGFIIEESGKDIFFHATKVNGSLPKENDKVEYSVGEGKRGEAAVDVQII